MKSVKVTYFAILSGLMALSCTRSPLKEAFNALDDAIAHREEYVLDFERQNDSLRTIIANGGGNFCSLWDTYNQLYERYRHFSTDSAAWYVSRMESAAQSPRERLLTQFARIQVLEWLSDPWPALEVFRDIDTAGISAMGLEPQYLTLGANLYMNNARFSSVVSQGENFADSLKHYQEAIYIIDTVTYESKKAKAQYLRSQHRYQESLELFRSCMPEARNDLRELISITYNCAILYGLLGDEEQKMIWLARCGVYDMQAPNRDFLSIYELALSLYRARDLKRASRYIELHFDEVFAGHFQPKMIWSSRAYDIILGATRRAERNTRLLLWTAIGVVSLMLFVIFWLWVFASRQSAKRAVALGQLADANQALEHSNTALAEANKIKENYVFRYMDLSLRYLDRVEEKRREYRQIAKSEGEQALLKMLKAPANYADYKEFYAIFDQTFLGIFPHFVHEVNSLLREDARFDETSSRQSLPTELRILATLKLGIDDSPRIASFLKCSLSTVYTYRAKMRNQAICPKEEFEERVKKL